MTTLIDGSAASTSTSAGPGRTSKTSLASDPDAMPRAAVMSGPSVPSEKRDPPSPFDDGRCDDAFSRNGSSGGVRLSCESRGCANNARVVSLSPFRAGLSRILADCFSFQFRRSPKHVLVGRKGSGRELMVWWVHWCVRPRKGKEVSGQFHQVSVPLPTGHHARNIWAPGRTSETRDSQHRTTISALGADVDFPVRGYQDLIVAADWGIPELLTFVLAPFCPTWVLAIPHRTPVKNGQYLGTPPLAGYPSNARRDIIQPEPILCRQPKGQRRPVEFPGHPKGCQMLQ